MNQLIIWRTDGQICTILVDDFQLDYECQVLDHDPMCKEYSVSSL